MASVADYRIGSDVLVERKTAVDLANTLRRERLWSQISRLRRSSSWSYLLIEGTSDLMPLNVVRGICLAASDLGVIVLQTIDTEDTARWLEQISRRRIDPGRRARPVYAQRPKAGRASAAEAMLAAVPGISVVSARALLAEFESVRGVQSATVETWQGVPGAGPKRAAALQEAVGNLPSHLRPTQMAAT